MVKVLCCCHEYIFSVKSYICPTLVSLLMIIQQVFVNKMEEQYEYQRESNPDMFSRFKRAKVGADVILYEEMSGWWVEGRLVLQHSYISSLSVSQVTLLTAYTTWNVGEGNVRN